LEGKHSRNSLQKTAILGTTHPIRKEGKYCLNPERWGSPLVQEKYQQEKVCEKRHPYRIIIIIIIIIIIGEEKNHEAPHYAVFSTCLVLVPSNDPNNSLSPSLEQLYP